MKVKTQINSEILTKAGYIYSVDFNLWWLLTTPIINVRIDENDNCSIFCLNAKVGNVLSPKQLFKRTDQIAKQL